MSGDVYTEPYDFALYPYSLGDALNWCVFSAIRAIEAGRRKVEVLICIDPEIPHNPFQTRPNEHQYQLMFGEMLPAFYAHPLPLTVMVFQDRAQFNRMVEERARDGSLPRELHEEYRAVFERRQDLQAVTDYFAKLVSRHTLINRYHARTGQIPLLREVLGCQADVENLIRSQGEGARIVALQFRQRGFDQAIPADSGRDAEYHVWERFLLEANHRHPQVRFVLLGRLQEKPLAVLQLPNVVTPRLLGMNLAHELSFVLRSHLFFGSSSGFAACANFSQTPYRIFNLTPNSCDAYEIPFGADRLPFATDNQRLAYGRETTDVLLAALEDSLAKIQTDASTGKALRTARPVLAPVCSADATTFRFVPDTRQARYEIANLAVPAVVRAQKNLAEGRVGEAAANLDQLQQALDNVHLAFSPSAPAPETPTLRELWHYWQCRLTGRPYFPSWQRPRVDFRKYSANTVNFHPEAWAVNGEIHFTRKKRPSSFRFKKEGPNAYIKSEVFRPRRDEPLTLVFEARRPNVPGQSSLIHLWDNGEHRTLAAPRYGPEWETFRFEFYCAPGRELNLQFDNDVPGHDLYLRNVFVGNAEKSAPPVRES